MTSPVKLQQITRTEKGLRFLTKRRRNLIYNICVCLGFITFYIIAYRDMLFQNSLFWATNLVPLPTSNARFYIPGQFFWYPGSLGTPAQPNIAGWLPYTFVLISGGNLVLAEKFLASTTLVSSFAMYFFLSKHVGGSRLARFSASLIYGFGPATVLNFADILHWGYAFIPIVFHCMFNLFEEKRKTRDILLLGLSLSFVTAFLPQVLLLIFISFVIFLVVHMLPIADKLTYIRKAFVSFFLASLVFVATSPYLISGAYQFFVSIGHFSNSPVLPPSLPEIYAVTYSNQEIATTIRLIGGSPGNHLPDNNWIGFILPIVAFSSLLLVKKGKKMLDLLALSFVSFVTITIIYGIHVEAGWALWLINNTPVKLFFYPERPLYIVTFAYCVMISVAVGRLLDIINSYRLRDHLRVAHSILRRNSKSLLSILLVFSLLASVFLFAPVFNIQIQQERSYPLPSFYSSIQSWLSSHDEGGMYRVMFLPTGSAGPFSIIVGSPDIFGAAPGYSIVQTSDYVDLVYNELVKGSLQNLGGLLAPASVKYIILATPNTTMLQGSEFLPLPLDPVLDLQGEPRYSEGVFQGDPTKIATILNNQKDLKLVYYSEDFSVYENEDYTPIISVFSNAAYIVGPESALFILPSLPGFSENKGLPIFMHQNPSLVENLSSLSSSIVFFNSDFSDYTESFLASKLGSNAVGNLSDSSSSNAQEIFEEAMEIVKNKKQVYYFNQDSLTFSKSLNVFPDQYYVAVNVPELIIVNPNMSTIDLDSAQEVVISKENFKPSNNSPHWDFDNANYYFVTATGGWFSVTFKGSGQVWAYLAYNATMQNIGSQTPFYFESPVENRTFDVYLPPNTSFNPLVNAYNPTMDQNVSNNLSEIIIERKIESEGLVLNLDGVNINKIQTPYVSGWSIFGPVNLDSSTHTLTVTNGVQGSIVAIYNTVAFGDIFTMDAPIDYTFDKLSETQYNVEVNSGKPLFISLSQSFHPNWLANSDGQQLLHFTASSFSNGFYLNATDTRSVIVQVVYEPPLLNQVYVVQQILFVAIGVLLIVLPIVRKFKSWVGLMAPTTSR